MLGSEVGILSSQNQHDHVHLFFKLLEAINQKSRLVGLFDRSTVSISLNQLGCLPQGDLGLLLL